MAVKDFDLTTKELVKDYAGITTTDDDDVIDNLIHSASKFIDKYLDRSIYDSGLDKTEYYNGGYSFLDLRSTPVKSITSISYRSGDYNNSNWTDYSPANDFIVDPVTNLVEFDFELPRGFKNIRVIYHGGYTNPATNEDIEDLRFACTQMVGGFLNKRSAQGVATEGVDGMTINWLSAMENTTAMILETYKRYSI